MIIDPTDDKVAINHDGKLNTGYISVCLTPHDPNTPPTPVQLEEDWEIFGYTFE